jgi:hypothetical protein
MPAHVVSAARRRSRGSARARRSDFEVADAKIWSFGTVERDRGMPELDISGLVRL